MTDVVLRTGVLDVAAAEVDRLLALLDDEERARAGRFRFARDRRRFIVRRGRRREWLVQHVGGDPQALRFVEGRFGKPALAAGPCFSASHSGERMMLAIADHEIGCDLEWIDPALDWRPLAASLFAPAEITALAALDDDAGRDAFFACWARKEAFVKAIGQGLSFPLAAFTVSVGDDAAILAGGDGWSLAAAPPIPGHAAAIVTRGQRIDLRLI